MKTTEVDGGNFEVFYNDPHWSANVVASIIRPKHKLFVINILKIIMNNILRKIVFSDFSRHKPLIRELKTKTNELCMN